MPSLKFKGTALVQNYHLLSGIQSGSTSGADGKGGGRLNRLSCGATSSLTYCTPGPSYNWRISSAFRS